MPMPSISTIMVTFHTGPALLEAMRAVLTDPDIDQLILVDNGNKDEARAAYTALASLGDLEVITGHGNIGFGRACNLGAQAARGDHLLFLNPDAILSRGAAAQLKQALDKAQAPAIAGALLVDHSGAEQRGSRRGVLTWRSLLSGFNRHTDPLPGRPTKIPTISGAAFMMRRADFDALDGFDPRYFLHVEDIDLCQRARKAGGDVLIVPGAKVMHYGATSDAPRLLVEWHKAKSFMLYFTIHTSGASRLLAYLCAPLIAAAVMGRAALRVLLRR